MHFVYCFVESVKIKFNKGNYFVISCVRVISLAQPSVHGSPFPEGPNSSNPASNVDPIIFR